MAKSFAALSVRVMSSGNSATAIAHMSRPAITAIKMAVAFGCRLSISELAAQFKRLFVEMQEQVCKGPRRNSALSLRLSHCPQCPLGFEPRTADYENETRAVAKCR